MEGVVAIYIRLKNGEELFTDYLGVGSIIGQYSMIEGEIMEIGARAFSNNGILAIHF